MDWADRVGRRITLRDLHVVLAVAEAGSMAKAADRLAISHPVVSQTIGDLEQRLGVRLFDRSSRGVELTSYGQALLDGGTAAFDALRQGLQRIEYLAGAEGGELRIGCPDVIAIGMMPALVEAFLARHPAARLTVLHAEAALGQFEPLRERRIDLLIGRIPAQYDAEDLATEVLFDETFLAYAAADSPWARRRRTSLTDLAEAAWTLPPYETVPGGLIAGIFRAGGLEPPRPRVATLSVGLSVALVASGGFVGLLPSSVLHFNSRRLGLKVLHVALPDIRINAALVTVRGRTLSPLAERFIECAREVLRPLARTG
jgi:DNA-binding transcriptional LysR family regulator